MGVMGASSFYADRVLEGRATRAILVTARDDVTEWRTIILSIPIGLLTLGFFLAMGGICALVGPWMLLAAIHLVRQQRVRKAGEHLVRQALQRMASIRINATIEQASERWERAAAMA